MIAIKPPDEAEALAWFEETLRLNGRPKVPQRVYKFLSPKADFFETNLRSAIVDSSVYLNSRSEFNDPFDTATLCEPGTLEDQVQHLRELSERNGDDLHKNESKLRTFASEFFRDGCFDRDTQQNLARIGICSLTTEIENLLMWAHYADSHRGVALIFNMHNELAHFDAIPVRYQEQFSRISPSTYAIDRMLFYGPLHKGADWRYENEWRILGPQRAGEQHVFHKSLLWGVVHGMHCKMETKKLVAELALERIKAGMSVLHLYDAKPRVGEFALDFFEDVPVKRPHPIDFRKTLPVPPTIVGTTKPSR